MLEETDEVQQKYDISKYLGKVSNEVATIYNIREERKMMGLARCEVAKNKRDAA